MANIYRVLGQAAPTAGTETALYTVPASTSAILSGLSVCNRDTADTTVTVSFSVGGGATATKDYQYYGAPLLGQDTLNLCAGMALGAGDVVRVSSASGLVSFTLSGVEVA